MANPEHGKFIVIDGNEGSGKATQASLLKDYFEDQKIQVATFDFPQYDTFHGKLIGRFQMGEFGNPNDISPYLSTYPYALDRAAVAPQIKSALDEGKIIIANRYVTSNFAHQSGRLPQDQRKAFVDWNMEFEYGEMGIPREDLVIYLFVPHEVSQQLMQNKERSKREYTKGQTTDLLESDQNYLTESEKAYLELVERFDHWVKIICVDKDGKMMSREKIHELIREELARRGII